MRRLRLWLARLLLPRGWAVVRRHAVVLTEYQRAMVRAAIEGVTTPRRSGKSTAAWAMTNPDARPLLSAEDRALLAEVEAEWRGEPTP